MHWGSARERGGPWCDVETKHAHRSVCLQKYKSEMNHLISDHVIYTQK